MHTLSSPWLSLRAQLCLYRRTVFVVCMFLAWVYTHWWNSVGLTGWSAARGCKQRVVTTVLWLASLQPPVRMGAALYL